MKGLNHVPSRTEKSTSEHLWRVNSTIRSNVWVIKSHFFFLERGLHYSNESYETSPNDHINQAGSLHHYFVSMRRFFESWEFSSSMEDTLVKKTLRNFFFSILMLFGCNSPLAWDDRHTIWAANNLVEGAGRWPILLCFLLRWSAT